jgi:ABC-type transport system substrate-binding protein
LVGLTESRARKRGLQAPSGARCQMSVPGRFCCKSRLRGFPKEKQNKLSNIVPDLAESWSWNADKTKLTFKLRQGIRWHDGKPFTAKDVQCTWNKLTGKDSDDFRKNPRSSWYTNLDGVSVSGDGEATFNLKRPQPSFIALLASGYSPVYPCHVSTRIMRTNPTGTGPFKFIEFKANEYIKVAKNPDYWKKGRPLLDGIEYSIIASRSTAAGLSGQQRRHVLPIRLDHSDREGCQEASGECDLRDRAH